MTKRPAVIFDRDGTLADVEFSRQFLEGDRPDWASFNAHIPFDPVVPGVLALLNAVRELPNVEIVMSTGREDRFRAVMYDWCTKYNIHIDRMLMRRTGDSRADDVIKREMYHANIKPFYDVLFVVDDRPEVCAMWKDVGLPLVQVVSTGILPPLYNQELA